MQPESPAQKPRRYRHLVRWSFIGILAILGWYGWKAYDFNQAVKEAKELGWKFYYKDPIALIRADWRKVFRKETWGNRQRLLNILPNQPLDGHYHVIRRLEPWQLSINATYPLRDLSELKGMSNLNDLVLFNCPNLTNIDAIKDLKSLERFFIYRAPVLVNIDGLKEAKTLTRLRLSGSKTLSNVDAARDLKTLQFLSFEGCAGLQNVDGILGLTQLNTLDLSGCKSLRKEAVVAAEEALPQTYIQSPYGT